MYGQQHMVARDRQTRFFEACTKDIPHVAVEIDNINKIGLRKDELKAQTLHDLGNLFNGFRKLNKNHNSLTRKVARESRACVKNFKKMAIMVKHTQRLVSE